MTITDAQTIIGDQDPNDWQLKPTDPPIALKDKAPQLWERLQDAQVVGSARRYQKADEAAGTAQTTFKTTAHKANWAVLLVALFGALTTAAGVFGEHAKPAVIACGLLGGLFGAMAAMWLARIKQGNLLAEWMTNRAKAETARIEYFDRATAVRAGDDPDLALLQLEYFRRYQLQVQLNYYDGRGKQHKQADQRTITWSTRAMAAASGGNAFAAILSSRSLLFSSLGSVGVIATACGAYLTNRSATSQDGRNAERYARTSDTLSRIQDRLDDVRKAVVGKQMDVLATFVKAVNDEVSVEHRQWLDEANRYGSAIQELEQKLAQAQKQAPQAGRP
jgi:hypothetical protein